MKAKPKPKVILLNSAMMPSANYIYHIEKLEQKQFVELLNIYKDQIESYIGYPQTAEYLTKISGIEIEVARRETKLTEIEGLMLIIKLSYRIGNTKDKGKEVDESRFLFYKVNYYQSSRFSIRHKIRS